MKLTVRDTDKLYDQIAPKLAGKNLQLVGFVLARLVAGYVASYQSDDKWELDEIRNGLLNLHFSTIVDLLSQFVEDDGCTRH